MATQPTPKQITSTPKPSTNPTTGLRSRWDRILLGSGKISRRATRRTPKPLRYIAPPNGKPEDDFTGQAIIEYAAATARYANAPTEVRGALIAQRAEGGLRNSLEKEKRHYQFTPECVECSGTGLMDTGECPMCGGRGYVYVAINRTGIRDPLPGADEDDNNPQTLEEVIADTRPNIERQLIERERKKELKAQISAALQALSARQRTILLAAKIGGKTQTEIAERLRIHQSQVSRDTADALEVFRASLPSSLKRYARRRFRATSAPAAVLRESHTCGDWWGEIRRRNGANRRAPIITCWPNNLGSAACNHKVVPWFTPCRSIRPAPVKYIGIDFISLHERCA
jgi:RNA polymerase sigma factor (sigma-70 family)